MTNAIECLTEVGFVFFRSYLVGNFGGFELGGEGAYFYKYIDNRTSSFVRLVVFLEILGLTYSLTCTIPSQLETTRVAGEITMGH